jgi:hypothetical protein
VLWSSFLTVHSVASGSQFLTFVGILLQLKLVLEELHCPFLPSQVGDLLLLFLLSYYPILFPVILLNAASGLGILELHAQLSQCNSPCPGALFASVLHL